MEEFSMAKTWKRYAALFLAALMTMVVFVGCQPDESTSKDPSESGATSETSGTPSELKGPFTYRTYTTKSPSNWNELTYEDNNDTQILNYIVSSFFEYDFEFKDGKKYNDDGSINVEGIVPGGYEVKYSAATKLEDVTSSVDAKWGYTDEQKKAGSYAWRITLREDLKWDDGTPITSEDFIYTMKEQLNPLFQNMRAATYYTNINVKGARNYVYQNQSNWYEARGILGTFEEKIYDSIIFNIGSSSENEKDFGKAVCNMRSKLGAPASWDAKTLAEYMVSQNVEATVDQILTLQGKKYSEIVADTALKTTFDAVIKWWKTEPNEELDFFLTYYTYPEFSFDNVGYYADGKYAIVVCLDAPIKCLKDDGTFSYEAAYSFASMPLVKKDLYESCKKEPEEGATLWTSTYNSSAETSASWGPYKLASFQAGKSYELVKNEYWYGYNLDDNKNQYLVDRITCEEVEKVTTQWIKFLGGEIDDIGLDVDHKADFRDSKYTTFAPGTGTFGMSLYANLDALKTSGRNNGILAIKDFRQAFSLYLDRDDMNSTIYTSHQSCYGILGPSYYHDIENAGVYRDTQFAKEGLLRTYGFTQNENGTWTDGTNTYNTYEDAYEVMNGMNRPLAKELVEKAYKELTENAETYGYDPSKKITLLFGTSADNENTQRQYNYVVKLVEGLVEGTSLEGKIEVKFDASPGDDWAKQFKQGAYDIAFGVGFSGGAFDPCGFLQCYLDPGSGLMYSVWWDVKTEQLTFKMPEGDYEGAGKEYTMSLYNWYCCLNGIAEANGQEQKFNWGEGFAPSEARLTLLSKLEEVILSQYYSIMTTSQYSASVNSAKFAQLTDEYNVFMSFGGMRYLRPVYNDEQWAQFVKDNNNDLTNEYKKAD